MQSPEIIRETPNYNLHQTLEKVRHLLEDFSEETPKQLIYGQPEGHLIKCQRTWFQLVVNTLYVVEQHQKYRGETVHPDITNFRKFYESEEFHNQERTTKKDIDQANAVLELSKKILCEFEKK